MRALAVLLAVAMLTLAGCALGDEDPSTPAGGAQGSTEEDDAPEPGDDEPDEAEAIRAWSSALNDGDFAQAASFFADGAVVEQLGETRLDDREDAVAFNRSLPCKADVTDVEDEGDTVLASFRLRDGPGGPCQGGAQVRFRFEDGKFAEWRQLPQPAAPEGDIALALCPPATG